MNRSPFLLIALLLFLTVACNQPRSSGDQVDATADIPTMTASEPAATEAPRAEAYQPAVPTDKPTATPPAGPPALTDVRHWLYLIDVNLEPETIHEIVASAHDMVVIDFIPSEQNNTRYPMAEVVARLHDAPHPKLVIAYIDIGQAEDFRTYWQPGWEIGDPEWIVAGDPDGWEGNYPVAYWYDEYQEVWLGQDGYLQAIMDAGFDGVYLDWVEAYSDEDVIALSLIHI